MVSEVYMHKLVELAKGGMEPDHVKKLIGSARGHAAGKASGVKRKMMKCEHEYGEDGTCEKCGYAEPKTASEYFGGAHRLFMELGPDGFTDWIQIIPGPGRFSHPKYGAVAISDESLRRYMQNFEQQVYQEHIPIDAEHQTKLSGALGYYREMKIGHGGKQGIWARIEPTERGRKLLDEGGFKYFSPEFYDEWEDPATGKKYRDVITGGAFTTRPFFKDKALEPIVMSEMTEDTDEEVSVFEDLAAEGFTETQIEQMFETVTKLYSAEPAVKDGTVNKTDDETKDKTDKTDGDEDTKTDGEGKGKGGDAPTQASEIRQLSEQNATMAAQMKQFAETNKQLAEQVEAMTTENRRRAFTEIVTGKGGANDGGPQWFGEPEKHIAMLERLTKAFGEDSEEVKDYIDQQNAAAKAITASAAFTEIGSTSPTASHSSMGAIDAAIKQYSEKNPNASSEQALTAVLAENPRLYAEYDKEFLKK